MAVGIAACTFSSDLPLRSSGPVIKLIDVEVVAWVLDSWGTVSVLMQPSRAILEKAKIGMNFTSRVLSFFHFWQIPNRLTWLSPTKMLALKAPRASIFPAKYLRCIILVEIRIVHTNIEWSGPRHEKLAALGSNPPLAAQSTKFRLWL